MLLTVREQQLGHFEPPYISTVSQDFKNEENIESQQVLPHHVRKNWTILFSINIPLYIILFILKQCQLGDLKAYINVSKSVTTLTHHNRAV